ncbi:serine hydrolase [Aestuariivivens sp. NBU2969]|uniref:serine hydrolase domain-containing protein n=1 Tax=Aestuariivivens sp. NBU2969 TaxID=2873267 RepID=UPI001CBD1F33|nr:serine hydrolase [Aestuariivivens sp. NBU2969]
MLFNNTEELKFKFLNGLIKWGSFLAFVLLFGCNRNIEFEESFNFTIELISGDDQIGLQNTTLLEDIIVRVVNDTGKAISGVTLNVSIVSGGGKVNNASIITTDEGFAKISWELGSDYNNSIEIYTSSDKSSSVVVNAIAKYKYVAPANDDDGWEITNAGDLLLNEEKVYDAIDEIRKGTYRKIHSILLSVNGKLILEEYFSGTNSFGDFIEYDRDTPHELQSVNKSFRGAMIGIAIDKGFIQDEKVPISGFFPELDYLTKDGKEAILLNHFLNMSSGLQWDESTDLAGFYETPFSTAHTYVLSKPLENTPGTFFEYNTGTSFVLNRIIMNAIDTDYETFARNQYSKLVESSALPGTGEPLDFRNTPRDMLKLGQVYLNEGKWKDTQVISKQWVNESTKVHFTVSPNSSYGYQWWIRNFNTSTQAYNCFYAAGFGGQFIFVIKELGLVAVFTGGNFNSNMSIPYEIMENYILEAFE